MIEEAEVALAGDLMFAIKPLVGRARSMRQLNSDPSKHGYDLQRFRTFVADMSHMLEAFIVSALATLRCMLLLSLCAGMCEDDVAGLQALQATEAFHASLQGMLTGGPAGLDPETVPVHEACRRSVDVGKLVGHVSSWAVHVELAADHASAHILNAYFGLEASLGGGFRVDEELRLQGRRWALLQLLLEAAGCMERECRMAEVGVFAAETSVHLLERLPLLHMVGVDPYGGSDEYPKVGGDVHALAQGLYARFWPRAVLHRRTSVEVAREIGPLDLVFVDGSHRYENVAEDLQVWGQKTRRLAGHDLNLPNGGVAHAVHEWAAGRPVHLLPDGVWYVDVSS